MFRPLVANKRAIGAAMGLTVLVGGLAFARSALGSRPPEVAVRYIEVANKGGTALWGDCIVEPVLEEDRPLVGAQIDRALAAYPPGFVRTNAPDGIAIAARITSEGVAIGGTNWSASGTLLVGAGREPQKDPVRAEHSVHHELFHLVLANHRAEFPAAAWRALNPPGFRYLERSGLDVLRRGDGQNLEPETLRTMGFAHPYALSNLEEDAAMVAETLMSNDRSVLDGLARYPGLEAKCRLLIGFYKGLDADFHPPAGWDRPRLRV